VRLGEPSYGATEGKGVIILHRLAILKHRGGEQELLKPIHEGLDCGFPAWPAQHPIRLGC
jgi:hypothetical protein